VNQLVSWKGDITMDKWEYKNLQIKTVPSFGVWSRISEGDLERIDRLQKDQWEVFQVVNIRGSFGFSAHILFMLRRKLE
jgi:hypothetical protein